MDIIVVGNEKEFNELKKKETIKSIIDYEIVMATEADREEIMALYQTQIGREYCTWDEKIPDTRRPIFFQYA